MKTEIQYLDKKYLLDLSQAIPISIPFVSGKGVCCFGVDHANFSPFKQGVFIGSIQEGSPVNFFNVYINPHGNGTHTECLGHISEGDYSIDTQLQEYHFIACLISLRPVEIANGDRVINVEILKDSISEDFQFKSLIIRTLPNAIDKLNIDYTNTNPSYFTKEAMQYIVDLGVEHLLVDLPSVDKEKDEGALAAHKIFWQTESITPRKQASITELIYVPNEVSDGLYVVNLQIAPFHLDASPSKPILYKLQRNE